MSIKTEQVTKYTITSGARFLCKDEAELNQAKLDISEQLQKDDFAFGGSFSTQICIGDIASLIEVAKILKKYNQLG